MKYELEIKKICGEDWKTVNDAERDGGYGVAIVIAYLRGVKPTLSELSKHIGVAPDELSRAFSRLFKNKAIGKNETWNMKKDSYFTYFAKNADDVKNLESNLDFFRNWSFVAAVAGGFLGMPN